MNKKKQFLLFSLLILVVFIAYSIRKIRLKNDFVITYGSVVEVIRSKSTKIKFQIEKDEPFSYPVMFTNKRRQKCKSLFKRKEKELKTYTFPVAHRTGNKNNAEILLFEWQYRKFNIEIPDSLEAIVKELSNCQ